MLSRDLTMDSISNSKSVMHHLNPSAVEAAMILHGQQRETIVRRLLSEDTVELPQLSNLLPDITSNQSA